MPRPTGAQTIPTSKKAHMPKRQANRNNDEVHRGRFAGRATGIDHARDQCFTRGLLPPFVPGAARASEPRSKPEYPILPISVFGRHAVPPWPTLSAPPTKFPAMSLTRRTQSALTIAVSSHFRR